MARRPEASVRANPTNAQVRRTANSFGLRATAVRNDPKTVPTPAPAPASPKVANPAPITLAAATIIEYNSCAFSKKLRSEKNSYLRLFLIATSFIK